MDGDYCLRMHLTDDLVHAVHETLDREARERDWPRRAVLLAWTRETLAQWRGGLISAEQAAASLRERGLSLRTATM
jgi:hypothetical protein